MVSSPHHAAGVNRWRHVDVVYRIAGPLAMVVGGMRRVLSSYTAQVVLNATMRGVVFTLKCVAFWAVYMIVTGEF